jgi:hypothetical protein
MAIGLPVRMTRCQVIVVVHVRVTAKDYGPGYSFATKMCGAHGIVTPNPHLTSLSNKQMPIPPIFPLCFLRYVEGI